MKKILTIVIIIFCTTWASGQDFDEPWGHIMLDSFTVTAVHQGLDIEDLIKIMQFDSTLYIAFNNLHFTNYTYESDIRAYDKKDGVAAEKKERVRQKYQDGCREQSLETTEANGNFTNRKGKEEYYTVELFNKTFYNAGKTCGEKRKTDWDKEIRSGKDKTAGHVGQIKKVVFNPGTPVDLPVIGKKFALFEESMQKYYDYAINGVSVNGHDCYKFTVKVKPEYASSRKDVIVRDLNTSFRTSDFQIVKRDYKLYYQGSLVKLDLTMDINLQKNGKYFYPQSFDYKGFWKVPLKGLEKIDLKTDFMLE
ncbi:MAG: hypothetical protein GY751_08985 [Bacteroidetes bacterium]|nr:hypothetical protein [Bacteroidota bacterium]